ncbi:MAG: glycoside hydrolase family 3 protein [Oscillospiraceae bacterium]|nr:glycoside hydrolase family 3 protein [Oscillospiraceae bacterium]
MKRMIAAALIPILLLLLLTPVCAAAEDDCTRLLASMTTEEKLTQMLMPALQNYEGAPVTELPDALRGLLERRGFGGVILFAENTKEIEQTVRLTDAMQRANAVGDRPQLLLAIDQEGGGVTRLGRGCAMPGNMALGAIGDPADTRSAAALIGNELRTLGIHVDFAPVVDVNSNPENPVIGLRSFSDDPHLTAEQGAAFVRGLGNAGVIGVPKHFPGHGDTATDSHTGLPRSERTKDELLEAELVPFRACIEAGAEMMMTAHIRYPQIETETAVSTADGEAITLPATLSHTILTDFLRGELGFDGVIVTDAMNMAAVAKHFTPVDAARRAIEAGADLILMPVDLSSQAGLAALDRYLSELTRLADAGELSMKKIDAAVLRILKLKQAHGLLAPYDGSAIDQRVNEALSTVGSDIYHNLEFALAKKAITLLKNENDTLPITQFDRKTVILTAYDNEVKSMQYALSLLRDAGALPEDAGIEIYSRQSAEALSALVQNAGHVLAVSEAHGSAYYTSADASVLDTVLRTVHASGGRFTLISAELPYDAARFPDADAILLAYGSKGMSENPRDAQSPVRSYGPNLPAALYLAFCKDASPMGRVPVDIPALDANLRYSEDILYPRGSGLTYRGFAREEAPVSAETPPMEEPPVEQTADVTSIPIAALSLLIAIALAIVIHRRKSSPK